MNKNYKIQFERNHRKEFFWRIVAPNGREIGRSSETYKRRLACRAGLDRMLASLMDGEYICVDLMVPPVKGK